LPEECVSCSNHVDVYSGREKTVGDIETSTDSPHLDVKVDFIPCLTQNHLPRLL